MMYIFGHLISIGFIIPISFHLLLIEGAQRHSSQGMEDRVFLRARCKAKCLRLFQNPKLEDSDSPWHKVHSTAVNKIDCLQTNSKACSANCFTACDQPPDQCSHICTEENLGCRLGCNYLSESINPRPGICPSTDIKPNTTDNSPQTDVIGPDVAVRQDCRTSCQSDEECIDPLHKCCTNECNSQCVLPPFDQSIPPLAHHLKPMESNLSQLVVELDWSKPFTNQNTLFGPIVFILQTRICLCRKFSSKQLSDWQTLIMTHQYGAKLDAFEAGKMYQFRIAAVNVNGCRGFGPPSVPYPTIPATPSPPSPPKNLTDKMWRFYSSNDIHVLLSWEPPERSMLPVTEYTITWVVDHGYIQPGGQFLEGLTKYTHTAKNGKTQYVLENLEPSTSYKIEVRAISHWEGYGNLESQPNTIFLSTQVVSPVFQQKLNYPSSTFNAIIKQDSNQKTQNHDDFKYQNCRCHTDEPHSKYLELRKIFFDNGELIAMFHFEPSLFGVSHILEWAPQMCINPEPNGPIAMRRTVRVQGRQRFVYLTDLLFNCRYTVQLKKLTYDQQGWSPPDGQNTIESTTRNCFCTPACSEVQVNRGPSPANCTSTDMGPPLAPKSVKVDHVDNLNYRVTWIPINQTDHDKLLRKTDDHVIPADSRYRISWAPRIDEPVSKEMYNDQVGFTPIMDLQQSNTQIVSQNRTWMDIPNLKADTFYILRIQTLSSAKLLNTVERESPPVTVYFVTGNEQEAIHTSHTTSSAGDRLVFSTLWPISISISTNYLFGIS